MLEMRYNTTTMSRRPYIIAAATWTLWALGANPYAWGQAPELTAESIADALPNDDVAEEVVETVQLGGEENVSADQEGVQKAGEYDYTPDEETPFVEPGTPTPLPEDAETTPEPVQDSALESDPSRVAYPFTRRNARTMSLTVPAPRGLITDRNGEVMATSIVAYQPAINFGQLKDSSDAAIIAIGRKVIEDFRALGLDIPDKKDAELISHYRHRRWLPLPVGPVLRRHELLPVEAALRAVEHSTILPRYIRYYPAGETAGHILGYTGTKAKLPTGPINHHDPLFEKQEGRSGLESVFDRQLVGRPGVWRLMFDESGDKILDELQQRPRPGGTVVTTLNLKWQKAAEESLKRNTERKDSKGNTYPGRGAFVMIDVHSGEVVVMASAPNFDPNVFIPAISQKDYDALRNDASNPLVSRAFAGVYPPASTFKTITIATALHENVITENSYIYCPSSIRIGNHTFRNHSGFEGDINCVHALAISNNPFMYQVAATRESRTGSEALCNTARRFGMGAKTGLPIADKAGNVPDEAWMQRNYSRGFRQGDAANISIGQGPLLATPLQVAQAMAGIANGQYLPKLHLVRQMLDAEGNVVYQCLPTVRHHLTDMSDDLVVVRKGMRAVVTGGSGRRAKISYAANAGKTGTAQWGKPSDDCRLAWFAGFIPADNPRYAYAALYEGEPHQVISGGRTAAAIVTGFFESEPVKQDLKAEFDAMARRPLSANETTEPATELSAEENARRAAEAERRRRETQHRHRTDNWDDGRGRR